ncbi:hypothetical protein JCM9140_1784 [Halalkalibacter wakoensis JCM 9140]|uniref:YtkA-like domain-containing protein n=1 Tax=Halalkalibacter wakoensis JCM 9140 TaxID=1236970 RepID=W4Q324_9BACI|nr:hypothetical protein [Halalkalibacter wakoensis]GAE25774.1 hypothetical protein JCM9140_1784 [Halalkalibacter wakoensis JCM 9140]
MMRLEREPSFRWPILTIGLCSILFLSFFLITLTSSEELETQWNLSFAGADEYFQTGEAIDFHIFLEDEFGNGIEATSVKAVFDRPHTVHQIEKVFSRFDHGLYGAEVVFSVPGEWIAMIEAKKGNKVYRNQVLFQVSGPVVSESSRDPKDHFHLEQPLPNEIKRSIENR